MNSKVNDIKERAQIADLSGAIKTILPALEQFNCFEGQDKTVFNKDDWQKKLDESLPQSGVGIKGVLKELNETVIPNGLRNGAPGFSGWITTAPTVVGASAGLASMVAGSQRVWNTSFNFLETLGLAWLKELLGIPTDWQGVFVSGGSVANIVGLTAARQWAFEQIGIDPAKEGLPAHKQWRIYGSSEVHHVIMRAAGVLGLGRQNVIAIPVDENQKIDLIQLRKILEEDQEKGIIPIALVASAGTVNTGVVDPINAMADMAKEFNAWLHVDGAYGLFGKLDPQVAHLYKGLERANSMAVDPHKWLAAPVGCGAAFVCDRSLLGRALTLEPAEYLEGSKGKGELKSPFDTFGDEYHEFGVAQSAPSRGVMVWAILKEMGAQGMRDRVIRHNNYARHLSARIKAEDRLEQVGDVELSICCFRYYQEGLSDKKLDELNELIATQLREKSLHVPSTTKVDEKIVIRPCFINSRTTIKEVGGLVDSVCTLGDEILRLDKKK